MTHPAAPAFESLTSAETVTVTGGAGFDIGGMIQSIGGMFGHKGQKIAGMIGPMAQQLMGMFGSGGGAASSGGGAGSGGAAAPAAGE